MQDGRHLDGKWMRTALSLASRGIGCTRPNPPVGALIVKGTRAVGAGYHRRAGGDHAEIGALKTARGKARGATLYVTLEPCCTHGRTPPCTDAIIRSGIRRVVVAIRDPNPAHKGRGLRILRRAGIKVTTGVCEEQARILIAPFAKWITTGMPFLTLKLAVSLDGKIADARRQSRWITSARARSAVNCLRQRVDAVLVGSGTVEADNPSLLPLGRRSTPLFRIVADSAGRLSPRVRLLNDGHAGQTIIATTRCCSSGRERRLSLKGATVWRLPARSGRVSPRHLLERAGSAGILHVLCEGGGELAGSLIGEGLVDEFLFFIAPRIIGGRHSVDSVGGHGWNLESCPHLKFMEVRKVGVDLLVRAAPAGSHRIIER